MFIKHVTNEVTKTIYCKIAKNVNSLFSGHPTSGTYTDKNHNRAKDYLHKVRMFHFFCTTLHMYTMNVTIVC